MAFISLTYSFSIMPLMSLHVVTNDRIFGFVAEQYSIMYISCSFLIHASECRHLGCSHILAIVRNDVVNLGMLISL